MKVLRAPFVCIAQIKARGDGEGTPPAVFLPKPGCFPAPFTHGQPPAEHARGCPKPRFLPSFIAPPFGPAEDRAGGTRGWGRGRGRPR